MGFIGARAYVDNFKIKRAIKIYHWYNALLCCAFALAFSKIGIGSLSLIPVLLSLYWLWFDIILNDLMGRPSLQLGTTAFLDRIFKNGLYVKMKYNIRIPLNQPPVYYREKILSPEHFQLTVKLICLGISIGIYIWFK
jgi:hypothetical protein